MIIQGDSLIKLKELPENSVDSIVTDPPYGLVSIVKRFGKESSAPAKFGTDGAFQRTSKGFMGKEWDGSGIEYNVELWEQCLRVLKPGGHLLAFGGSRTYHRLASAVEDAGFEIRDQIMYVYGSGFPKSHNISKALDKVTGTQSKGFSQAGDDGRKAELKQDKSFRSDYGYKFEPTNDDAKKYEGWGTALKPAHEPIVVARKPLSESTIAENVLKWGTGGINIDGCRVEYQGKADFENTLKSNTGNIAGGTFKCSSTKLAKEEVINPQGRFPANFLHDGSDEVVGLLGEPARFFYCAKASKKDRNEGLEGFEEKEMYVADNDHGNLGHYMIMKAGGKIGDKQMTKNHHPTVKPTALMQYLVRLVTPKGGTVLDCFMGSGSTGKACKLEGFDFIGIELDPEYCKIAEARIESCKIENKLF